MGNKTVGELKSTDQVIDPSTGTILSNDLSVENAKIIANNGNIEIKGGSFIQTNSDNVFNYSAKNTFIQAEATKYGPASTGTKGFCILGVDPIRNTFKLSGELSSLNKDYTYSIALFDTANSYCIRVLDVIKETNEVSVNNIPKDCWYLSSYPEGDFINEFLNDDGDNAFYAPQYPYRDRYQYPKHKQPDMVGEQIIQNFYGGHVEGGSSKAIGKYTHAEGRECVADMRYSHAEGDQTFAGGIGSHAEGKCCLALGNTSHASGREAVASCDFSYVWNGDWEGDGTYGSQGSYTYNINPVGDTKGFYIGKKSLQDYLDEIPEYDKALKDKKFYLENIGDIQDALSTVIILLGGKVTTRAEEEEKKKNEETQN